MIELEQRRLEGDDTPARYVLGEQPEYFLRSEDADDSLVFVVTRPLKSRPQPVGFCEKSGHIVFFVALLVLGLALSFLVDRQYQEEGVSVVGACNATLGVAPAEVNDDLCALDSFDTSTQSFDCTVTHDMDWNALMGTLLFNGGFAPLVMSLWAFAAGIGLSRARDFLKSLISLVFFGVGVAIWFSSSQLSVEDAWQEVLTSFVQGLFEIGALFFVSKFFFLAEDDEVLMDQLQRQLRESLASPGTGMAMSYFYNFIIPTCSHIRSRQLQEQDAAPARTAVTPVEMELSRGKFEDYQLLYSKLLIFIPRDLQGTDMKRSLKQAGDQGITRSGRPKRNPEAPPTHRPMFMYFLHWDAERKVCSGMFDVPTIISSCWDRSVDREREQHRMQLLRTQSGKINFPNKLASFWSRARRVQLSRTGIDESPLEVNIRKEVVDFQNELLKLIRHNTSLDAVLGRRVPDHQAERDLFETDFLNQKVVLVSVPSLPMDFAQLRDIARDIIVSQDPRAFVTPPALPAHEDSGDEKGLVLARPVITAPVQTDSKQAEGETKTGPRNNADTQTDLKQAEGETKIVADTQTGTPVNDDAKTGTDVGDDTRIGGEEAPPPASPLPTDQTHRPPDGLFFVPSPSHQAVEPFLFDSSAMPPRR